MVIEESPVVECIQVDSDTTDDELLAAVIETEHAYVGRGNVIVEPEVPVEDAQVEVVGDSVSGEDVVLTKSSDEEGM